MKKKKINPLFDIHRTGMNVTFINSFKYSDTDTSNFIDAVRPYDTTLNYEAIANLVLDLKAGGNWLTGYAMWIMYGGSADSCKFNLFDPRNDDAAFRLTYPAGITASAAGIVGNGSSQYCRTYFTGNLLTQNNTCLLFYSGTNQARNEYDFGITTGATSRHVLISRYGSGDMFGDSYNGTAGQGRLSYAHTDSRGLFAENRTASNNHNLWIRGNKVATGTGSGGTLPILEYQLMCLLTNSTRSLYSNKICSLAGIIPGRSDTQMTALYNAIQAYQTRLGRQF